MGTMVTMAKCIIIKGRVLPLDLDLVQVRINLIFLIIIFIYYFYLLVSGDVIGCGLIFRTGEIFFTKNGYFLGTAWSGAMQSLYPSVGLHSPREKVVVNFGTRPFKFNFEAGKEVDSS